MKPFLKILSRILIVLVILLLVGYAAYKIAYPYVAPLVFDYLVDRNSDMFEKLEESLEAAVEPEETPLPDAALKPEETPSVEEGTQSSPVTETTLTPTPTPKKPNTDIQTVHTTMGDFTGAHLVRALKNISPADKTRIISICQQAVSMSDIATVTQILTQDGLTVQQQKFIENYLRDNLSVPAKREILTILKKY